VTIGALNNYASVPGAFGQTDVAVGQEVAAWVALAVGKADMIARTVDELAGMRAAMVSRAVIEQAKGILMERHQLTEDQAFTELTRASQNTNIKLRDVADELVRTRALPHQPATAR
jgi:AmiR/NasT family two-component response regulator